MAPVDSIADIAQAKPLKYTAKTSSSSTSKSRDTLNNVIPIGNASNNTLPDISSEQLLQKARRLDKVSSKISCAEIMLKKGSVAYPLKLYLR